MDTLPLLARGLATITSPPTLTLSLLLIAAIVAWWVWISGHLMRPRTSGIGVVAGIPRTAGRGEHGTSNLMTPAALETSAVTWSPGTTPGPGVSGFVIGATPAERGRKETYYLSGSEGQTRSAMVPHAGGRCRPEGRRTHETCESLACGQRGAPA